jgi:hypothetical protein
MENPHKSMQNMIITLHNILICWNMHQQTTKFMHEFCMHQSTVRCSKIGVEHRAEVACLSADSALSGSMVRGGGGYTKFGETDAIVGVPLASAAKGPPALAMENIMETSAPALSVARGGKR